MFLNRNYFEKLFKTGHFLSWNLQVSRLNYYLLLRSISNHDANFTTFEIFFNQNNKTIDVKFRIPTSSFLENDATDNYTSIVRHKEHCFRDINKFSVLQMHMNEFSTKIDRIDFHDSNFIPRELIVSGEVCLLTI